MRNKFKVSERVKTIKVISSEFGAHYYYGYPVSRIPVGSEGIVKYIYKIGVISVKFDNDYQGIFKPNELELIEKSFEQEDVVEQSKKTEVSDE